METNKLTADPPLNLEECTLSFAPKRHFEYSPDRLQWLKLTVKSSDHDVVGKISCIVASRGKWSFKQMLEDTNPELKDFAEAIFDAQGLVKACLIDGGYRSGSGCWGEELNVGKIVYVFNFVVMPLFQNRGVESWILKRLLEAGPIIAEITSFPGPPIYFCRPQQPIGNTTLAEAIDLFRKIGFRRIGRTEYMGYSPRSDHPSRRLFKEEDPDQLGNEFEDVPNMMSEQRKIQYPLHSAIQTNKTSEISAILKVVHALDNTTIHRPDDKGFTPLHIAAAYANPHAVRTLLELGATSDLQKTSNSEHVTPLDALQDKMRRDCEVAEVMRIKWEGHSREALACEFSFKKALHLPLENKTEGEYYASRRFGCTCGSCLETWLSPRMMERLKFIAWAKSEFLEPLFSVMDPNEPLLRINEDKELRSTLAYLPLDLASGMNRSFYLGLCETFKAICYTLAESRCGPPTPREVIEMALRAGLDVHSYLSKGGRVEYALDAVLDIAEKEWVVTDWFYSKEVGPYCPEAKKCANDLAFLLVRTQLGVEARMPKPFFDQENSDEKEEEEYDKASSDDEEDSDNEEDMEDSEEYY
ncbi:hypothetical protein BDN70DRAFT_932869 [Pholiota conissans]|uniref:Uncharacterized protein n=1 Tax=Pholiota conissans TaxID=109636 RepID=A0A9P5Z1H7_9AGAR|nr:hypothetical protein BDN70DRAFT_932869 [Pholiota conissans]